MTDTPQQDEKSRSQAKREHQELKSLGIQLAGLPKGQLRAMPLSKKTLDALLAAKLLTRNSLQRQYRYLAARLAEEEDVVAIREALSGNLKPHADEVAALHEAEQWRDRLLAADEAELAAFVEEHPACDRAHLRRLVRNANKEREREKPPRSARQLYRYLRQLLEPQE